MSIINLGLPYLNLYKKINKNRVQHLFKCHNTKIGSFNKSNTENTYIKSIIHVWCSQPTGRLPHKSCMANSVIFKF